MFHLSNLNFGLHMVKWTCEAVNVVMITRKSNRQYYNKKNTKYNKKYKQ